MNFGYVLILVLFTCNVSHSQARQGQSGSSAQSSLTVTATVESSVWLIMEPNGKREVVVAQRSRFKRILLPRYGQQGWPGKRGGKEANLFCQVTRVATSSRRRCGPVQLSDRLKVVRRNQDDGNDANLRRQ